MQMTTSWGVKSLVMASLVGAGTPVTLAETINVPDDHATIQDAIDASEPGDTIIVEGGFHGPVIIDVEGLTLVGDGALIDGTGTDSAVEIAADDVKVEGFELLSHPTGTGLAVEANDATVVDNSFSGGAAGIVVGFGRSGCYIADNYVFDTWNVGISLRPFCVDNHIVDNRVEGGNTGYLSFLLNEDNLWEDNVAVGNAFRGFFIQSWGDTFIDNLATQSLGPGFYFQTGKNNILRDNTASENAGDGFMIDYRAFSPAVGNILTDNKAVNNGGYGFSDITPGDGTSGTGNLYTDNSSEGNGAGSSNPAGLADDD
jgi:nitrous oxidase accessory protein